jgi:hypothetical protein
MHALLTLIAGFTAKAAVKLFTASEGQVWL